ncbi:hypothetical protein Tco_0921653 [Tanacetum coccineum]
MVATLRVVIHAGDKTSGDASSWYMISGDAKCVVSKVVLRDALRALVLILCGTMLVLVCRSYLLVYLIYIYTQAGGAQSSRVPIHLPDDPYVMVRQAQLVDTELEPEEVPFEAEEFSSPLDF